MISVILCTYNDSQYLKRALESILIQKIQKEIIVVDDCSTIPIVEESMEIIRKNDIKIIRHTVNKGLSASRNTGIEAAMYDLIIPLDADDYFYPRAFLGLFSGYSVGFDIIYGNMTSGGTVVYPYTGNITKEILLDDNPLFSSSLFTKKIWYKAGGYKVRDGAHYEDWNFWCKCFLSGAIFKHIPVLVYEHTERSDSMLRKLAPNKEQYVKIATEELVDS